MKNILGWLFCLISVLTMALSDGLAYIPDSKMAFYSSGKAYSKAKNKLCSKYQCGDLLKMYAEKPKNLNFVKCELPQNDQTVVKATYKVSGKHSRQIENFLVKNYGMGKLKWVCCGWETGGKYGSFEHPELTRIDSNLSVIINMYASGEINNEHDTTKTKLISNRDQISFFTVVVALAII